MHRLWAPHRLLLRRLSRCGPLPRGGMASGATRTAVHFLRPAARPVSQVPRSGLGCASPTRGAWALRSVNAPPNGDEDIAGRPSWTERHTSEASSAPCCCAFHNHHWATCPTLPLNCVSVGSRFSVSPLLLPRSPAALGLAPPLASSAPPHLFRAASRCSSVPHRLSAARFTLSA